MADKSLGPHDYAALSSLPASPSAGYVRLYARNGKLYCADSSGNRFDLTLGKKTVYREASTNSAGQWSVSYVGEFDSVDFIVAQAIHETGGISEQKFASLHTFNNSSANGRVVESAGMLLGGQGLEYSEAGVRVLVRIEGSVNIT